MRLFLFILLILLHAPHAALASNTPDMSTLKRTGSGKVHKIIDGLTILLKDENIIRLSSLDIPNAPNDPNNTYAVAARDALQNALPAGTEVIIYQTRKAKIGRENRMGHSLAHIVTKKDQSWVNGLLVENGLARVMPTQTNTELTEDLFALEHAAILSQTGLWAQDEKPTLTPDTAARAIGEIAVIEGSPVKAASVRNALYLNFGANWKTDFTVMLSTSLRKKLAKKGIDPTALAGEKIRVRGFVRSYNGPFLELMHEDHLQILDSPPSSTTPLQPEEEIPTINPNP